MTLWPGTCIVHEQFSEREIIRLKAQHPDAKLAAHPECPEAILKHADHVGSTRSILNYVTTAPGRTFLIATEEGIIHQMKKLAPDREYIPVPPDNGCRCNECPFMKLNTLEKLYLCLRDERPEILLPEELRKAAEKPLLRMLELLPSLRLRRPAPPGAPARLDAGSSAGPPRVSRGRASLDSRRSSRPRCILREELGRAAARVSLGGRRAAGRHDRDDGPGRDARARRARREVRRASSRGSRSRGGSSSCSTPISPGEEAAAPAPPCPRRRRLAQPLRARPRDPDGRARGAEPPPAHVRHRDRDAPFRRRRRRHALPDPRHAQDRARACVRSTGRPSATAAARITGTICPRWSSSRTTTGGWPAASRAPSRPPGRGLPRRRPSKSRSSRRRSSRRGARRPGADRILIDNQTPETVARWCAHRARGRPAALRRGLRQHDARRRVRAYALAGRRRGLGRRADALGRRGRHLARARAPHERRNDRRPRPRHGCRRLRGRARRGARRRRGHDRHAGRRGPRVQHLLRAGRHRRAARPATRPRSSPPTSSARATGSARPRPSRCIAREGPDLVQTLLVEELAVPFDREGAGFHWTLEGAHSVPRVLHVKDETGAPIERALIEACRTRNQHPVAPRDDRRRPADALARLDRPDRPLPPAGRHRRVPARARDDGAVDAAARARDDPRDRRPRPGLPPHDQSPRGPRRRLRHGAARRARAS